MSQDPGGLVMIVQEAIKNGVKDKEIWKMYIRRVEGFPKTVSWIARWSMIRMALLSGETRGVIREVVLELFEERALSYEEEATLILLSFAHMSNDRELLSRFSEEPVIEGLASKIRRFRYQYPEDSRFEE